MGLQAGSSQSRGAHERRKLGVDALCWVGQPFLEERMTVLSFSMNRSSTFKRSSGLEARGRIDSMACIWEPPLGALGTWRREEKDGGASWVCEEETARVFEEFPAAEGLGEPKQEFQELRAAGDCGCLFSERLGFVLEGKVALEKPVRSDEGRFFLGKWNLMRSHKCSCFGRAEL